MPGCAACDANAMIIGRVQRRKSVRQRVRLPLMVLGRSLISGVGSSSPRVPRASVSCPVIAARRQSERSLPNLYGPPWDDFCVYARNIGISRHKSGGGALIAEIPDTFQSRWISLGYAERACAEPAENWNSLKQRNVILDRHDGPPSRHQFVAAHFSDQGGRSDGVLLDLLP